MRELGFIIYYFGIDLLTLSEGVQNVPRATRSRYAQRAYITLEVVSNDGLDRWLDGYPWLSLLLRSLKPWEWTSEGKHTLYMEDCNVELNIGVYAVARGGGQI